VTAIGMSVNPDGFCVVSPKVTCTRIAQGQYRVSYHSAFDKAPFPVIMPVANSPVPIGSVMISFDAATNSWIVNYSFADGEDHVHSIISATGY
jgi:hypothetical protein